jgi:dihydrofolate reductase
MGKVVVSQFVTVDGVIEDPGGAEDFARGGWAFKYQRGEEGDKFKLDELMSADALLLGRVTWEGFAAAWPGRQDPMGFADKFNSMPKYVASTTLRNPEWENSHVLERDLSAAVEGVKARHDGDVLVNGSASLCQELGRLGLVDEWRLMVFPTVLGEGKRLFGPTAEPATLTLDDVRPVGPDGVVILTYLPAASASDA